LANADIVIHDWLVEFSTEFLVEVVDFFRVDEDRDELECVPEEILECLLLDEIELLLDLKAERYLFRWRGYFSS
jgi:hypothetical protein